MNRRDFLVDGRFRDVGGDDGLRARAGSSPGPDAGGRAAVNLTGVLSLSLLPPVALGIIALSRMAHGARPGVTWTRSTHWARRMMNACGITCRNTES
ncbi:MAG: hypothetical protein U0X87_08335 [Anaerolineales bacterium]